MRPAFLYTWTNLMVNRVKCISTHYVVGYFGLNLLYSKYILKISHYYYLALPLIFVGLTFDADNQVPGGWMEKTDARWYICNELFSCLPSVMRRMELFWSKAERRWGNQFHFVIDRGELGHQFRKKRKEKKGNWGICIIYSSQLFNANFLENDWTWCLRLWCLACEIKCIVC